MGEAIFNAGRLPGTCQAVEEEEDEEVGGGVGKDGRQIGGESHRGYYTSG